MIEETRQHFRHFPYICNFTTKAVAMDRIKPSIFSAFPEMHCVPIVLRLEGLGVNLHWRYRGEDRSGGI